MNITKLIDKIKRDLIDLDDYVYTEDKYSITIYGYKRADLIEVCSIQSNDGLDFDARIKDYLYDNEEAECSYIYTHVSQNILNI